MLFSKLYLLFIKLFGCKQLTYSKIRLPLFTKIKCHKNSLIVLGNAFNARDSFFLNVSENASIKIGENCFFNRGCSINCHNEIIIGNNVIFGENVLIYDHDHRFSNIHGASTSLGGYNNGSIHIGNNCWIASNCIILRGSYIEDNCLIAAGTIVKGRIPKGSLVYNERKNIIKANYSNIKE